MNVKIAFLNSIFEEEIHIDQSIGFVSKGQEDKVYRLKRSMNSFKQSSKSWYFRFREAITLFGLPMVSDDHYVYFQRTTRELCFLRYALMTYYWLGTT